MPIARRLSNDRRLVRDTIVGETKRVTKRVGQPDQTAVFPRTVRVLVDNKLNCHAAWPGPGSSFIPPTMYQRGVQKQNAIPGSVTLVERNVSGQITRSYEYTGVGPFYIASWQGLNLGPHLNAEIIPRNISTNQYNRLSTECLLKLKDMEVNIGEALAESKSTVQHLARSTQQVIQALLAARRGNWHGVAKALRVPVKRAHVSRRKYADTSSKEGASRWLEYQFGWLPLLGDIHGSYEQIQKGFREKDQLFSVKRKLSETEEGLITHAAAQGGPSRWESTRQDRMKLYAKIDSTTLANASQLGLTAPLQVAWAVVPFSFVVDWFMPIGNLLEGLTAGMGCEFVGGYYSSTVKAECILWETLQPGERVVSNPPGLGASASGYSRVALGSFPWPGPYVKSPFSTSHAISALALLRQLWR